ncbi:Alpha-monoglucosyldiacylglycerol synthase [bioreactor metagenome]|uniref:Alpha-monoglucosyldiacylglycerol synthase n=1 Tax=bioreactor metagenome TaxID=1076179 RepID=A0A644YLH6_9ZZZZ
MRIGLFTDSFLPIVDGVGRVVHNYARTVPNKGHECYVIAPMSNAGYLGDKPYELLEFLSIEVPTQRQYSTGIPTLDAHYRERIRRIPLDIVHAHSPFLAGREALFIARKKKIPVVGTFHSRYYDDFYKLTKMDVAANIGVKYIVDFYNRCDEVWAVSESSSQALHEYGFKRDIIVMPNGISATIPGEQDREQAIRTLNLPRSNVLLYCGQINWKKNILRILNACVLLKEDGRLFTLVLAGQGPDMQSVKDEVKALGLAENTMFTGHITDEKLLNGLYQATTLFVFPSIYDTCGLVVREAAAMGTPAVVVEGSGAAEQIIDRENGFICLDNDLRLHDAIVYALDQPDIAKRVGMAARKTLCISWDSIIDSVINRYANLIKKTD